MKSKSRFKPIFLCMMIIVLGIMAMLFIRPLKASAEGEIGIIGANIYANGNAITLKAGSTSDKTLVYLDSNPNTPVELTGPTGDTTIGYDLSGYTIYGGKKSESVTSTVITMLGGSVTNIYGGGHGPAAGAYCSSESTNVTINGGTILDTVYGGGNGVRFSTGITNITINGGTMKFVFGGGNNGCNVTNANVTINNGTISDRVYGGGYTSYTENTNVTLSGGTMNNVYGGGRDLSAGKTNVIINSGTMNSVYGGGSAVGGNALNTNVTINGGIINTGVYGGCSDANITGNAIVKIGVDSNILVPVTASGGGSYTTGTGSHIEYEVAFYDGLIKLLNPAPQWVTGNSKAILPTPALKNAGKIISGWEKSVNNAYDFDIAVTAPLKLHAVWEDMPTYYVAYHVNGATGGTAPMDSNIYYEGQDVTILDNTGNLSNIGYTFGGWALTPNGPAISSYKMKSDVVTFYAVWLPTYGVTYDANGATSGTVPTDSNAYVEGANIPLAGNTGKLAKTGYTFGGWTLLADGKAITSYTMKTAPITFYAVWKSIPKTYTVTYDGNGATSGTAPTDSNTYTNGANVPLAGNTGNLTKTGYTFGGWALSTNGKAITSYTMETAPVTFYAVWTLSNQGGNNQPVISSGSGSDSGSLNTPAVMPFPANSNGTGSIVSQVQKAKDGESVDINMNGTTTLKSEWLEAIAGRDVDIVLDMGNGIKWTINGKSITGKDFADIDLKVKKGTKTIPTDVINNITGEKNVMQFTVTHSGEFGFTATISMDLGEDNKGLYANLYYYNEETEELEFIDVCKIGANGSAAWDLEHTSTYAVVIDKVSLAPENVEAGVGVEVNESLVVSNVTDDNNNVIAFMVLILISAGLFTVKLKNRKN